MMHYPGPKSIPPGESPGGVVVHVYSVPGELLLVVQKLSLSDDPIQASQDASDIAERSGAAQVCLVAYDGDSGERFPADAWIDPEDPQTESEPHD